MAQSTSVSQHVSLTLHPLDIVEQLVEHNDWAFDRRDDDEIAVQVSGMWCEYSLYFAWNEELKALHFSCAFEMRVSTEQRTSVHQLLALINQRMWLGHFGLWVDEGLPMFRHATSFRGTEGPTKEQIEDLIDVAILECERFYPAFQHLIWAGKTAEEAVAAAMIETVGEA